MMKKLALTFPGQCNSGPCSVTDPKNFAFAGKSPSIVITSALEIIIYIAAFLMFFWLIWGVFQYIFAGGDKEQLARARKRITWAIVGFFIVLLAFTMTRYLGDVFQPAINPVSQ